MTIFGFVLLSVFSGFLSFPLVVKIIRFVNSHFGISGADNVEK